MEPPKKIRTVVVDDEPLARTNISLMLKHDPEIEIVRECGSGMGAMSEIGNTKPDRVFLVVQTTHRAQELEQAVFCRIHRSTMLNLDRVRGLRLGVDGEYEVLLDNGTRLRMSRRYCKQLQSRLGVRGSDRT